jgi:DNA ligase (NAD+)
MTPTDFLEKLHEMTVGDLISIKGIGTVLADNIIEFTHSDRYQRLCENFSKLESKNSNLTILASNTQIISNGLALSGMVVCITGTFDIPRSEIKTQLESLGAKVVDSVTKSTTRLLAGENAGSKLAKAQDLGITINRSLAELII